MGNIVILLLVLLITSCSLKPTPVQLAAKKSNHAVVFDIDGTLTPQNISIFTARNHAADVVRLYADKGYKIIYLSARNRFFQFNIPDFLKDNGFPRGSVHVPQSAADRDDFSAFKQAVLQRYLIKGWKLEAAYGDSTTDFTAYADAGINKNNIYALKRVGEKTCQPGPWAKCLDSWSEQMSVVGRWPVPSCPTLAHH